MNLNIRIYWPEKKRMFRSDQLTHIDIRRHGEWSATIWDDKTECQEAKEPLHRFVVDNHSAVLMLSTGHPDFKGNEIFEDDVVLYELSAGTGKTAFARVKWSAFKCGFTLVNESNKFCGEVDQVTEVIGNIHESGGMKEIVSDFRKGGK